MRTTLLLLLSCCLFSFCFAQQDSLKTMMDQGIGLHNKGDYEGAIKIYDQVIGIDNNYYQAYYEKSLSLYTWTKYQDCADLSKEILRKFPDYKDLRHVYVNYGSSMDVLGQTADALKIYSFLSLLPHQIK